MVRQFSKITEFEKFQVSNLTGETEFEKFQVSYLTGETFI